MKSKLLVTVSVSFGILVLLIGAACWLRWGYKTRELTLERGPVAKVAATETETILFINPDNADPIRIQDGHGIYNIPRDNPIQRLTLSSKGIEAQDGTVVVEWKHSVRYVPASSYRVFSRQAFLGRVEMTDGTSQDYYLPR